MIDAVEEIIDENPRPSPSAIIVLVGVNLSPNRLRQKKRTVLKIMIVVSFFQDDRDEADGGEITIDRDANDLVEEDPIDEIEHSDPVYDYQLDIDCNEMPITIDELSMGVGNSSDMVIDGGK